MQDSSNGSQRVIAFAPKSVAITVGLFVVMVLLTRLVRRRAKRRNERGFRRILHEVEQLHIPDEGKDALREVVAFARELAQSARARVPKAS
jgi:hypothetical protein